MNVYVQYLAEKPGLSIQPSPKSAKNSSLTLKEICKDTTCKVKLHGSNTPK